VSSSNVMCSSRFNVGRTLISRRSKSMRPALSLRAETILAASGPNPISMPFALRPGEGCKSSDILASKEEAGDDSGMSGLKEIAFQNTLHARASLMRVSAKVGIVTSKSTYLFLCSKCPLRKSLDPTDEFSDGLICPSFIHHKLDQILYVFEEMGRSDLKAYKSKCSIHIMVISRVPWGNESCEADHVKTKTGLTEKDGHTRPDRIDSTLLDRGMIPLHYSVFP